MMHWPDKKVLICLFEPFHVFLRDCRRCYVGFGREVPQNFHFSTLNGIYFYFSYVTYILNVVCGWNVWEIMHLFVVSLNRTFCGIIFPLVSFIGKTILRNNILWRLTKFRWDEKEYLHIDFVGVCYYREPRSFRRLPSLSAPSFFILFDSEDPGVHGKNCKVRRSDSPAFLMFWKNIGLLKDITELPKFWELYICQQRCMLLSVRVMRVVVALCLYVSVHVCNQQFLPGNWVCYERSDAHI